MEDLGRGHVGDRRDQRAAHQRPVGEDEGGRRRGDVRPEQQQRVRRDRPEGGQEREPLARAAAADAGPGSRPDGQVDEQPDEQHRARQVRRDRLAAVAEADRLAPEPGLEADERDGPERRPEDRAAVAVVADGQDRQGQDQHADDRRDGPVDPLDPGLVVVRAAG